jgi:hypothetical protein
MPTSFDLQDVEQAESLFDSVAHEFITLIEEKEKEVTGKESSLIGEYYVLRNKLQARLHEIYPQHIFQNF